MNWIDSLTQEALLERDRLDEEMERDRTYLDAMAKNGYIQHMDLRTLPLASKIDLANRILETKEGDEFVLNGEVWFRIDQSEFKVSTIKGHGIDEDDCSWVLATTMDIVQAL